MTSKKFVKAFLAGVGFPAVFLPLAYTMLFFMEYPSMKIHSLQFVPMYIPIVFGLANMLFVRLSDGTPAKNLDAGLWTTGACLGFIVAVIGVFVLHVPTMIFGDMHGFQYLPLIALPIIYGVIFRYVVKWLNKAVGIV